MSYREETWNLEAPDGIILTAKAYHANQPVRHVVIHHGLGEHSGRYGNVLQAFSGTNTSFYTYDIRGHGLSQGKKGHASGIHQLAEDLEEFIEHLDIRYNIEKPFLHGHSLGGLVALFFAIKPWDRDLIRAVSVSGPALKIPLNATGKIKKKFGDILGSFLPALTVPSGLNAAHLSRDSTVVREYKEDRLVHDKISSALGIDLFLRGETVLTKASDLKIPVLLQHGEADQITDPSGSREFFDRCPHSDKTLLTYSGFYHEIYNDTGKEKPLADLRQWILAH